MSKLLLILTLVVPTFSFALGGGGSAGGNGNSMFVSRMELLKLNRFYVINMPALTFEDHQVGIGNLCIDESEVRTIDPVVFEGNDLTTRDRKANGVREAKVLAQPLFQQVVECLEIKNGQCAEYTSNYKQIKTEFNVDAYAVPRGHQSEGPLKYRVKYQLPPCSQL